MEHPYKELPTPCYVVEETLLKRNLELLSQVKQRSGCKILLAQKGFSMFRTYPLIGQYLDGTTASSLYEARLGKEEMGGEVHIFAPAYRPDEFAQIVSICDHIVFNSFHQWRKYRKQVQESGRDITCGIRINPEYSEIETDIYNPCIRGSRLGVPPAQFEEAALDGIEGLHFHTMCEQNADVLWRTIQVVDEKFGPYLHRMKWKKDRGG